MKKLQNIIFQKKNKIKNILEIKINYLLNGCKISNEMFDERGNRDSSWGIDQKKGHQNI